MPSTAALDVTPATLAEFDRQVEILVQLGYPGLTGHDSAGFRELLNGLRPAGSRLDGKSDVDPDNHIPFVIVVNGAPVNSAAEAMRWNDKPATLMLDPDELVRFRPVQGIELPSEFAYLLLDIDVGTEFCNVPPRDALPVITERGRTPLTIAEGIALVSLRPDRLRKNRCFSLVGSRCGDSRVPAVWISKNAPKLGWCWNGAPHTWLGSASTGGRLG